MYNKIYFYFYEHFHLFVNCSEAEKDLKNDKDLNKLFVG